MFRASTGASSVMIARQAEWNCSIFRKEGKLPLYDVIKAYLIYVGTELCCATSLMVIGIMSTATTMLLQELVLKPTNLR